MRINGRTYRLGMRCSGLLFVFMLAGVHPVLSQKNIAKPQVVKADSIRGQVIDILTKKAVLGASVQAKDARFTSMSDENGRFSLAMPAYLHTLFVSAPGYEKKEVVLYSGQRSKVIGILPAGYVNYYSDKVTALGAKRKATVSTSLSTLDISNTTSYSIDAELRKKFSGDLNLSAHSGSAASGLNMLIRGVNSINANNQPLIVIDGVVYENRDNETSIHLGNNLNSLAGIDVNDIQSVSVLKDGTSIYGSKGGNGVILINTNRGKGEATQIALTASLGFNERPKTISMMNADQNRVYLSDLLKNNGARSKISNTYFLSNSTDQFYYNKYHNNTDWADGIYTNSGTQNYSVAVNGGDEVALYNMSFGFTNAINTLKESDFTRINARFNSDIKLTKDLTVAVDVSYSQTDRNLRNDGFEEYTTGQVNSPGILALIKSPFLSPYKYNNARELTSDYEGYDFLNIANPYGIFKEGVGESQQKFFNLSVTPTLNLSKNLSVLSHFNYSNKSLSEGMFSPMDYVAPYTDFDNNFLSYNYVKSQYINQSTLFCDSRLNWKKDFHKHAYDLNAGVRILSDTYKSEFAYGHNTGSNQVKELSSSLTYRTVYGVEDPYKLVSYYGVFNYGYNDKYFAEVTASAETSSRFGKETQSGFQLMGVKWACFPSVNAAWLICSENFMKNVKFVDQLKLRAGIGLSGNDDIEGTASRAYFSAIKYANNATGLVMNNIANPAIEWEKVTKRNVGLDANLFNSRLSLSFDLYHNTTDNLLTLKTPADYSGFESYWANDGKLQNKGYELGVNVVIFRQKDFNMTLGGSVAHYKNKILSLANGNYLTSVYGGEILTAVNQPIGQFYGYKTKGVYATTEAAKADGLSIVNSTGAKIPLEAGDVQFVNQNNDNVIDEKDKVVIGNANPDIYGSLNAGFKYKKLGVQFVFNYSYGNDVYNYQRSQLESGSTFYNQTAAMTNRWLTEGQVTKIPKSQYGDPKGNNRFSDRWIEDGSFLRLKTLELSYELPVKKIAFLQGVTVWASCNNLWTLTKYLGADPEFYVSNNIYYRGIDAGLLPQSRSYYAGVKINL